MLPRWHVLYGALFTLLLYYLLPDTGWVNLACVFLASFLIDIDHYISAVKYNKSFSIKSALTHYDEVTNKVKADHKKGLQNREPHFHALHTMEVHLIILGLGFIYEPFLYVFMGMAFHSILDVYALNREGYLYIREYFLLNWIRKHV